MKQWIYAINRSLDGNQKNLECNTNENVRVEISNENTEDDLVYDKIVNL